MYWLEMSGMQSASTNSSRTWTPCPWPAFQMLDIPICYQKSLTQERETTFTSQDGGLRNFGWLLSRGSETRNRRTPNSNDQRNSNINHNRCGNSNLPSSRKRHPTVAKKSIHVQMASLWNHSPLVEKTPGRMENASLPKSRRPPILQTLQYRPELWSPWDPKRLHDLQAHRWQMLAPQIHSVWLCYKEIHVLRNLWIIRSCL